MSDEQESTPGEDEIDAPSDDQETAKPAPSRKQAPKEKRKSDKSAAASEWQPHPIVSPTVAWALVLLNAALVPVGFVGIGIWPVAFIAWVPLIIALRGQSPKNALWMSWVAGTLMTLGGFYWLVPMLEVFSGFPLPLCVVFAILVCIQKGGRNALLGWMYARATQRGWHHGASFAGAFAVSELIYPVLFPWYFGAALHDVPVLIQTADIGGPILVTLVVIGVNVALAELLQRPVFRLPSDMRTVAAGFALPLVAVLYGTWRIGVVDAQVAQADKIKVGMVQGNTPLKKRVDALRVHLDMTEKLRQQGVDLVVWSEAGVSRSFPVENYQAQVKARLTKQLRVPTIVGTVLYERTDQPAGKGRSRRYFNTALMADEDGNITGRYDKQFLLMFGEYLPLGDTFPVLYEWSPNSGAFSPGTSYEPLVFRGRNIATMICYEDIAPGFVNKLVDVGDPELFVNMTNDAWFGDTSEPWQHSALAKFRSVEHHKYMVRVTNSGVTAIFDPVGRETVVSGTFTQEALIGEVGFMKGTTVYAKLGDIPWWIATGFMALAAFVQRRRPSYADGKTPSGKKPKSDKPKSDKPSDDERA